MHKIFIFIFILLSAKHYSQTYKYDYVAEYEVNHPLEKHKFVFYKFFNSTNNDSYLVTYLNGDKVSLRLQINDGKAFYAKIDKDDFLVEAIGMNCPARLQTDDQLPDIDDFRYIKHNDTIINTEKFSHVSINAVSHLKRKNHDNAEYIIYNPFDFSVLAGQSYTLFDSLKSLGNNLPKGIIKQVWITNKSGVLIEETKLLDCVPIKKMILLETECN